MSLCPRSAAQALHSPPELHQQEYKHNAAYFDEINNPQYALHPSTRYGPDQEPLLESQNRSAHTLVPQTASAIRSYLSSCRTFLFRAVSPRSQPTAASMTTMPRSRKAWLPILLCANLLITAISFTAACIHFNTFTTLFLYLALLIVAFPILSLSLCIVKGSDKYKLQLSDLAVSSTPLSEQSFSSFSDSFSPASSPVLESVGTGAAHTRRRRTCRGARLRSLARMAQYVGAVLWFLALAEWLFFQPILPAGNATSGDEIKSLINASPSAAAAVTSTPPIKVFIVSNLYNSEEILPTYTSSLKSLVHALGIDNVFVSIYESHSTDRTKSMLAQLDQDLDQLNVTRRILSDDRAVRKGKLSAVADRIRFLADVRNTAMQPLLASSDKYTHVLWINDIVFTPQDALQLLRTNHGRYDQACAMDFIGNGFYDTWVTRDANGDTLKRQWPYFKRHEDVEAMRQGKSFEVDSCWNGISAFAAKWFYPSSNASAPRTPAFEGVDEDGALQLPLTL